MPGPLDYGRRRPVAPPTLTRGELRATSLKAKKDLEKGSPDFNLGLGLAKVFSIDYEGHLVSLRTLSGASQQYDRVPVPMTYPGAGARHFLGAMPQEGDHCVVGWIPHSGPGGGTKTPIILTWVIPGVWPGRDWLTTAEVEDNEFDPSPGQQSFLGSSFDRIRHKLRHIQPGNIVASSAQGADLVLDEGVTISNRRGNEIRLRDQDQALVTRSLQQFHAMAGARIYAGMVQRDATFLPEMMVSDGDVWDGPIQATLGQPIQDYQLPPDTSSPAGFLTPARLFHRDTIGADDGYLDRSALAVSPYLDPYRFLKAGGFIDDTGYVVDSTYSADGVYGGKPIYRVTSQSKSNATLDPNAGTLTEYRIELNHTSKGRLPVTEQTDMLDAERLPGRDPTMSMSGPPVNAPFMEWVMGSVVGNDPFTNDGRTKYGMPLIATIFDGNVPNPRLEPAKLAEMGGDATPTPLLNQAASLFRLTPPSGQLPSTFWSVNKQGQLRAAIGGNARENSIEAFTSGGLKLGVAGKFQLLLNGHMELGTLSKSSMDLTAAEGAVRIYGGGPLKGAEADSETQTGDPGDLPSVDIEAKTNARMKAGQKVTVTGNTVEVSAGAVSLVGRENISIGGSKRTVVSTEGLQVAVNGKAQESYGGPKYNMPTNGALHERTYSPSIPGLVCEKVEYKMGDREETFTLGSHTTTVKIGNLTYETNLGTWKAKGTTSELKLSGSGFEGKASTGVVSLKAQAGSASMTGSIDANVKATVGTARVTGGAGVYLGGPITGPDSGPILCAGSLEPFTGLPFSTWGMGAKAHNIGV